MYGYATEIYKPINYKNSVLCICNLTNLDIPIFEQTADALSTINQCDNFINKEGMVIEQLDRYGNEITKEHPTIKIRMQYMNIFRALSGQLGMCPSTRAQIVGLQQKEKEDAEDPLLQLLKRHG